MSGILDRKEAGKSHTWELYVKYHRCPSCGKIVESRKNYVYHLGVYEKELSCPRCGEVWMEKRPGKVRFGPLLGDEKQQFEFNWES